MYRIKMSLRTHVGLQSNMFKYCIDRPPAPISQPPPAVVNDISIYLNDFDEDETRVVQLYSPTLCNLPSPVRGWTPPDGIEDVDIDKESLRYPPRVSRLGRARREHDDPRYLSVNRAVRPRARRTRGVLSAIQSVDTASTTTHIARSHPYREAPKGGIPPGVARDMTKLLASRTQRESNRMHAAAARAFEGRRPSVMGRGELLV